MRVTRIQQNIPLAAKRVVDRQAGSISLGAAEKPRSRADEP